MKTDIHPELKVIQAVCSGCNTTFDTLSVDDEIRVEICADCHPFFTGEQRFVDTEGRVESFERRYGKMKDVEAPKAEAPKAEAKKEEPKAEKAEAKAEAKAEVEADAPEAAEAQEEKE